MKKFLLGILFTVLPLIILKAQSPAQVLRLARSTFEQGRLHELEGLLAKNIKSGFNDSEKIEAYKLLTQAYIYLEEPDKADESMLSLLRIDPEFKVNDAIDPAEFIALYNTFRTKPIYRLGIKAGANATKPNVKNYNPDNNGSASYSYGIGFQIGLASEIPLSKKLTLNPELNFQNKSFKFSNNYFDRNTTSGTEHSTWINVPVTLQYELIKHKLNPYIAGGFAFDYLLTANNKLETLIQDLSPVSETSYDEKELFKSFNVSSILAAGVKSKIDKSMLIIEVRYCYGLSTITDKAHLYSGQFPLWDNKFIHGLFSMNTLALSVSYQFNKYNPKKITR